MITYFISYAYIVNGSPRFGNAKLEVSKPITFENLKQIEGCFLADVKKCYEVEDLYITNFIKMEG